MLETGNVYELDGVFMMLERVDIESSPYQENETTYVFRRVQPSSTITDDPETSITTTTARNYDTFVNTVSSIVADFEETRSRLRSVNSLNTWDFSKIGSWKIPEKEKEKEADEENNPEDWLNLIGEA